MVNDQTYNNYTTTPRTKQTIEALWRLEKIILDTLDFNEVVQKIVNSVLTELEYFKLGYRIVVLALVDKRLNTLKRISISQTPEAIKALSASPIPFYEINIPLASKENFCIQALDVKKPYSTSYWPDILCPAFNKKDAEEIQKIVGIKTSLVYPVVSKNEPLGVLIFSMVKSESEVTMEEKDLIAGFTDIVGIAVQNSGLYSTLEKTTKSLKDANERLQEVDRLKDEFVSLASHELRTPMTVIKSYLWYLVDGKIGSLNEKQRLYLDRAYSSTDRLINLVNDMLNVSRIESGRLTIELKSVDIKNLAREVIEEMMPKTQEQGISLELEKSDELVPQVNVDPDRIKQVFINLIGNSLKFTDKGGNITISFSQKDGQVVTKISDNGQGIPQEEIPKLFQKFETIGNHYLRKSNTQGTGLGLYISKSIVNLHGGKIWAESDGVGKGSTFSFSLPIFEDKGR